MAHAHLATNNKEMMCYKLQSISLGLIFQIEIFLHPLVTLSNNLCGCPVDITSHQNDSSAGVPGRVAHPDGLQNNQVPPAPTCPLGTEGPTYTIPGHTSAGQASTEGVSGRWLRQVGQTALGASGGNPDLGGADRIRVARDVSSTDYYSCNQLSTLDST